MLWKFAFLFVKNFFARYGLFLVGSTMTGFGANSSDIDLCLTVTNGHIDQKNEAYVCLDNLQKLFMNYANDYFKMFNLYRAKVPILRFRDVVQGFDIDINCNNMVGVRNTHLLHCYSQMNWRIRPLVLIVKKWARDNKMNSAHESTISSYSLTLMVIHYLQYAVSPPIVPCLHAMYPDKFDPDSDIHRIRIHEKLKPYPTDNKQSLGELLLGFFNYFTNFDYSNDAISVRLASVLKKESCQYKQFPKNDPSQWQYICIEEPFDLTNTARSVYQYNTFLYIKTVFKHSFEILSKTMDLNSIFNIKLPMAASAPKPNETNYIPIGYIGVATEEIDLTPTQQ